MINVADILKGEKNVDVEMEKVKQVLLFEKGICSKCYMQADFDNNVYSCKSCEIYIDTKRFNILKEEVKPLLILLEIIGLVKKYGLLQVQGMLMIELNVSIDNDKFKKVAKKLAKYA